jgi:hypothetical protein
MREISFLVEQLNCIEVFAGSADVPTRRNGKLVAVQKRGSSHEGKLPEVDHSCFRWTADLICGVSSRRKKVGRLSAGGNKIARSS